MGPVGPADIFLLERFRFDRRSGGLFYRDSGAPVLIGSRALGVLGVLLGRAGDLISKDEIIRGAHRQPPLPLTRRASRTFLGVAKSNRSAGSKTIECTAQKKSTKPNANPWNGVMSSSL